MKASGLAALLARMRCHQGGKNPPAKSAIWLFNQLLEKCRILVLAFGVVADSLLVLDASSALGYHEGGVVLAKGGTRHGATSYCGWRTLKAF
jgi:hypothetical protein